MRKILISILIAAAIPAAPAIAQKPQDQVLVIFGNDKCPTNASGEEIVVCARRPEGERYRIPKELRQSPTIAPENQSWAARAQGVTDAGSSSGIGSCSSTGAGGWTGCFSKQMRAAKAQRQQDTEASAVEVPK